MSFFSKKFPGAGILILFSCSFLILNAWAEEPTDSFLSGYSAYIEKDFSKAMDAWKPLAEAGNPEAQYLIGVMHFNGQGVEIDFEKASRWFLICAKRGDVGAQYFMGVMNEEGKGMNKNLVEAGEWYQKAAEQGYPDAQLKLGEMYQSGEGRMKNLIQAYGWFRLAGANGIESGENQSRALENTFSKKDLERARTLANQLWDRYELPTRLGNHHSGY